MADSNVIDLKEFSRPDRWDEVPLARHVAFILHRADISRRWRDAKARDDWSELDRLDRESRILECY